MNFPTWAPPSLVRTYEAIAQYEGIDAHDDDSEIPREIILNLFLLTRPEQARVLHSLLTDPRMESVWTGIKSRIDSFEKFRKPYDQGSQERHLWNAIQQAKGRWKSAPKLTPAEMRQAYREVRSGALRLYHLIDEIRDRELNSLSHVVGTQCMEILAELLDIEDRDYKTGKYTGSQYVRDMVNSEIGSMQEILFDLANHASQKAEAEETPPLAISQAHAPRAELRFFIEGMSRYFQSIYRTPLDDAVATLASVIYGVEVEGDTVRYRRNGTKPAKSRTNQSPS